MKAWPKNFSWRGKDKRNRMTKKRKEAKKTWRLRMARDETDNKRKRREDDMSREE